MNYNEEISIHSCMFNQLYMVITRYARHLYALSCQQRYQTTVVSYPNLFSSVKWFPIKRAIQTRIHCCSCYQIGKLNNYLALNCPGNIKSTRFILMPMLGSNLLILAFSRPLPLIEIKLSSAILMDYRTSCISGIAMTFIVTPRDIIVRLREDFYITQIWTLTTIILGNAKNKEAVLSDKWTLLIRSSMNPKISLQIQFGELNSGASKEKTIIEQCMPLWLWPLMSTMSRKMGETSVHRE